MGEELMNCFLFYDVLVVVAGYWLRLVLVPALIDSS